MNLVWSSVVCFSRFELNMFHCHSSAYYGLGLTIRKIILAYIVTKGCCKKTPFLKFCFRDIYAQTALELQNSCPPPSQYPHNYVGYRQEFSSSKAIWACKSQKQNFKKGVFLQHPLFVNYLPIIQYWVNTMKCFL